MPPATPKQTNSSTRAMESRLLAVLEQFHWLQMTLGLIGNVSFFVGSVMFLFEPLKTAGIWLFIVGSFGMLMGTIGDVAVYRRGDA